MHKVFNVTLEDEIPSLVPVGKNNNKKKKTWWLKNWSTLPYAMLAVDNVQIIPDVYAKVNWDSIVMVNSYL